MEPSGALIPAERIERAIVLIRGHKVMLDRDLARLYGVTTGALNQAVQRNLARFPEDFMFRLSKGELEDWRSQFVISNPNQKMGLRLADDCQAPQQLAFADEMKKNPPKSLFEGADPQPGAAAK